MQPGPVAKPTNHQPMAGVAPDTKGKHRIAVELKRLESEIQHLQEDLEELETTETVSAVLEELLTEVEKRSDPLLPITTGPVDPSWDQWFEGPQNLHGHRCWLL
ncbi:G-protein gamma-like domain-containing protein [Dioscorea alata]|uniref:G-protein gamma-like domain-containing protein n=1 Tax=Dioscorea alata TaxID=55571 RepID=A0ACB7VM75_DIOAL|nr:G-protein gamma-like domain-containing protein [Dioscorea alata]